MVRHPQPTAGRAHTLSSYRYLGKIDLQKKDFTLERVIFSTELLVSELPPLGMHKAAVDMEHRVAIGS